MKTIIFRNIGFCSAIWLLAACSHDRQPLAMDDDDSRDTPIQIAISRSTTAGDDGETDTKFTPGCLIGISVGDRAEWQNMRYKYPSDGSTLEAIDSKIYWNRGVSAMPVEAYYPYQDDGNYVTASVEANQNTEENYYKSDALYATGTVSRENMTLPIFTHRMTKVIFLFSKDVSDVEILNQSLNTGSITGDTKIKAYKETERKWKVYIVPGQSEMEVSCNMNGQNFKVTCAHGAGMVAGRQYIYRVGTWRDKSGNVDADLSFQSININDNDTYHITQSGDEKITNGITINGSPTVHINGLNVSADAAISITSGTPTVVLEGANVLKSTANKASGIQLSGGANTHVLIKGTGSLTVEGGKGGTGIGGNDCGNITIEGCTINAFATEQAYNENLSCGAGIGSQRLGTCGDITIKDATITAKGIGAGAGIGGGVDGKCGNIAIIHSIIKANGTNYENTFSAAIGAGAGEQAVIGNITITLSAGQSKAQFLENCSAYRDKVGYGCTKSGNTGTVGTITWQNSDGTVIP